ncbi:MAG: enoyl-CoA hydratase/isomerase family protein, partial [Deltaproteobacteria bacterium]|nr:enoyl-CoA hydratase/isomerase family protein [Deltaproteobacteria bacterium]
LKELMTRADERGGFAAVLDQRRRVLSMIESMGKPSVATLFGYCLGGGLELPLACHLRIAASEGVRIGLPELDIGTMPAWGGTVRLSRLVGAGRALDIILRVRKLSGPEALAIGLVTEVHPPMELKQRALALAHELAAKPATAVAGILGSVIGGADLSLDAALDVEREAVMRCGASPDQREGMLAFAQKRRPVFNQGQ